MLLKVGSIGKGLATMSRRKSWKAVEPYEASSDKDDLSIETSEDAYIQTYSELLAESAPLWSTPPSRRPIFVEKDYSSDESESTLSEALINESRANQIADRLRSFEEKKNPSCNSESTRTTSSSTNDQFTDSVDSSQSSGSKHNKGLSSSTLDGRPRKSTQGKEARLRSSWAEMKNPSRNYKSMKSNEGPSPALFTPDNPPPPPPRPNTRRAPNLFPPPPPPPPPPAPLKTDLKARRMSYGDSMRNSRRLSKSFNEAILSDNRRRVSFSDEHSGRQNRLSTTFAESKQMSKSFTDNETSLSGLKKMQRRGKRASISSTSVVVPRNEHVEPGQRSKHLSKSLTEYAVPKRKDSAEESFSSSMPNVLSDHSQFKSKSARFHDDSKIQSPSLSTLPRLAPKKSQNADDDEDWSDILSAVEDRTQASSVVVSNGPKEALAWPARQTSFHAESSTVPVPPPVSSGPKVERPARETSFYAESSTALVPQSPFPGRPARPTVESRDFQRPRIHRIAVGEVAFDRPSTRKAIVDDDCSRPSSEDSFRRTVHEEACPSRGTSFHEDSARFPVDSKQQNETKVDEEPEPSSPTKKEKNTKDKGILNKIPLLQKVRNRSFSIDDDAPTAKSSKPKYDKQGRCEKHPSIIIAKKRPFAKGWDIIQTCPRCSQSSTANQVAEDYCGGVDELLAPSNRKKYDWQLASSFTSTKSNGSNDQKCIAGASDFLAKSDALRSANSLSEAASRAISLTRINDSPSKQSRSSIEQIDLSARSGSSRQSSRHGLMQINGSMEFNNNSMNSSFRGGYGPSSSHFDSSMNDSMKFDDHARNRSRPMDNGMVRYPNQLDYSTKSEGRMSSSRQQLDYSTRSEAQASARSSSTAVVSKMPYKTPWGQTGWYSGEVDHFGVPNGEGRMRFKSGEQHIGQWTNGYSEQYIGASSRMKRGFGTNVAPWKELDYNGYL